MITTLSICEVLGRQKMALRLGVTKTAISNAAVEGAFPARWFVVLSTMCREVEHPCPLELFSFAKDNVPQEATGEDGGEHERGAA